MSPKPSPSFAARIAHLVLQQRSAKTGLAWIAFVTACAIFAPFLASSHPLLMKSAGRWSSPLLQHLHPTDAALPLLALCFAAYYLAARAMPPKSKSPRFFLVLCFPIVIASAVFVRPPLTVVYEQHRLMNSYGQINFALYPPIRFSPNDRQRDQPNQRLQPPSLSHPMGTDSNAADVASQMIHASRTALTIGFIATGIALIIGVVIGGLMGYFSGWVDLLGMRLVEIFSAIPKLFLLLSFVAFFPDNPRLTIFPSREIEISRMYAIMAIIGLTSWVGDARFIRAEFLKLRKQDFVQAAIACGLPLKSILFRHMLPNGVTPVLVGVAFGVAGAILSESFLSFLGLGLVEDPSWGSLLSQAVSSSGSFFWWIATFPGLSIFFTVLAYNLVGEAMRDALDPQSHSKTHA